MDRDSIPARRKFLGQLGLTAAGTLLGTAGQMPLALQALAAGNYDNINDYKTVVCVYLNGGTDTHNAFVPYELSAYNDYAAIRQDLAIARGSLLTSAGSPIGFHPAMTELHTLYDENKLAIAANVGNLFEPMNPQNLFDFYSTGQTPINIPDGLFSHEHQQKIIQLNRTPVPGTNPPGWGGAMADRLTAGNVNPDFPAVYSIAGLNAWQTGETTQPFNIQAGQDVPRFEHFGGDSWPYWEAARTSAWQNIINQSSTNVLETQAANMLQQTVERSDLIRAALESAPEIVTPYNNDNWLANQLRSVANLISIRETIGTRRQFFFVSLGGWDTHNNHLQQHNDQLAALSEGLFSFQRTLEELGVSDSTTTFTFSEFGRTLTINGDGVDHGWSADQMVMGGAVNGGAVHGNRISYTAESQGEHWGETLFGPSDVGSGRFIPEYSMDQYGATIARWMGITESDLDLIFPNLTQFALRDLGFMQNA